MIRLLAFGAFAILLLPQLWFLRPLLLLSPLIALAIDMRHPWWRTGAHAVWAWLLYGVVGCGVLPIVVFGGTELALAFGLSGAVIAWLSFHKFDLLRRQIEIPVEEIIQKGEIVEESVVEGFEEEREDETVLDVLVVGVDDGADDGADVGGGKSAGV